MSGAPSDLRRALFSQLRHRSQSDDGSHRELTALLRDRGILQRTDQRPELRPDLGAANEAPEPIDVRQQDVLAHVGGEVVMADELRHALEHLAGGGDEGLAQVMHDGQRKAPVATDIFEDDLYFVGVLRADLVALENLTADRIHAHEENPTSLLAGSVDVEDVAAPARQFDGDLLALATLHEALESHADENVVGDFGPPSHDAR